MAEKTYNEVKLYGWDDGKVYFWDEENKHEWCVSDDEALYERLVQICRDYFLSKSARDPKPCGIKT